MSNNPNIFSFSKIIGAGVLCSVLIGSASAALAYTGEELAKDARVNFAAARVIALRARPGKITDEELEKESGGSGLRYSFDIKNAATTYEGSVATLKTVTEEVPSGTGRRGFRQSDRTAGR